MPLAQLRAVRVDALDLSGIGNIAGLDHHLAVVGGELERLVELRFVMARRAAGFMVPDQPHALLFGIGGEHLGVEVFGRLREIHVVAVAEPVPVPADVPAFDQHVRNFVGGGEIDVLLDVDVSRAVLGPARPAPLTLDHVPPYADEFAGLEP